MKEQHICRLANGVSEFVQRINSNCESCDIGVDSISLSKRDWPVWIFIMCGIINTWTFDIKIISFILLISYGKWYLNDHGSIVLNIILWAGGNWVSTMFWGELPLRYRLASPKRDIALELWSNLSTSYLVRTKI